MIFPQRRTDNGQKVSDLIAAEIEEQIRSTNSWSISPERLCDLCDLPLIEYYRGLYNESQSHGVPTPGALNTKTVQDVLPFLESNFGPTIRRVFYGKGVLFDFERTHDLSAACIEGISEAIDAHSPEVETYQQMLSRFKRHDIAFETYRSYFFQTDTILCEGIGSFLAQNGLADSPIAKFTAGFTVEQYIARNAISIPDLFSRLAATLRHAVDPSAHGNQTTEAPIHREHLKIMGLEQMSPSKAALRRQYKVLMKTYHPDVNPAGLKMCQRINEAYGFLITQYNQ